MGGIKLPESGATLLHEIKRQEVIGSGDAFIINPYFEKDKLTRLEAIDCINHLSGVLVADGFANSQK